MSVKPLSTLYRQLLRLYRHHFFYLLKLSLFFCFQFSLLLFSLGLFFLPLIPWYITLILFFLTWEYLALGLMGLLKNLQALINHRGEEKYPLLSRDYLVKGNQLLLTLLVLILPVLISLLILVYSFYDNVPSLLFLALSLFLLSFFLQWYFGLSILAFLEKKMNFFSCWFGSFHLVNLEQEAGLVMLVINYFLLLIFSLFLPVIGTLLALMWLGLSSLLWRQELISQVK